MTWNLRDNKELTEKAMDIIAPEIDTMQRDELWLTFIINDLTLTDPPAGFFSPIRLRGRNEVCRETRINLPVPVGVNASHIHHLVHHIIRAGYDFHGVVHHPERKVMV